MLEQESDEALMLRYAADDSTAFECLYARHKGPLYRYLLRQVHDKALAEELFQDIWLRIIAARARYQPSARFRTFLYHLAHNRLIDQYRRSGRTPIQEQDCPDHSPAARSWQPDVRVENQQAAVRLLQQIENLPDAQRETFLLKEEAGLSLEDIAQITQVNKETVKSRLRYAMRRLRAGLGESP